MIAGFQEKQIKVAEAIVKGNFRNFLDIGASEGGLAKTVVSQSKGLKAIALDPNSQMEENFNTTPDVKGVAFVQEAYQGSWTEADGTKIKEFKPKKKFDVINEDFAFQFINNNRAKQVKGVSDMLTKDGIFITSEKFIETDNYQSNEDKKYDHQKKYFNESELTKDKQEIVTGMAQDMVNDKAYENTLKNNFKFVEEFWNSGNFKGYIASNNKDVLNTFKDNVGDLTTEFTDKDSPLIKPKETIKSQMTREQAYDKAKKSAAKSRKQAAGDNKSAKQKATAAIDKTTDQLVDRQGSVKRALKNVGLDRVVDYMVTKSGHSSHAKNRSEIVYSKVFKGLSNELLDALDEVLLLRRIVAIDQNRSDRGLDPVKHQDGFTGETAQLALDGYRDNLGDSVFDDLTKRADEYFAEYKKLLKDMKEEGLISEESFELFAEVDYQPRMFLDFLEDMDGNLLLDEVDSSQKVLLSDKQIKAMKTGSEGSQLMDAWYLIQKSLQARSASIFSNRVNKVFFNDYMKTRDEVAILEKKTLRTRAEEKKVEAFKNLSDHIKIDEVISYTKNNTPKYKLTDANTKGFKSLYFYEDGKQNRILMSEEFHQKFTDTANSFMGMTAELKEAASMATGTAVVKTLATGNNPLFFLTNTPRDFAFILAFSGEYGKNVALSTVQLGIDAVKGVKDVVNNTESYQKFLDYGGGMDYLAVQGKFKNKGFAKAMLDNVLDQRTQYSIFNNKIKRNMDKFNLASEMGMRLAVFNKSVSNQLKGQDINKLDKQTRDDIYTKAVRSARELTDFNQGGKLTKALDAGIPYLNAATQGTRAAANNLAERPVETVVRITQILGFTVASTVGSALGAIAMFRSEDDEDKDLTNTEIYFNTLETVSEYDLENYFIMPLGYKDGDGNWRYLRVAKAQALSPTINITEHFVRKALAKKGGVAYKQDLGKTIRRTVENNILPLPLSMFETAKRIPLFSATTAMMGYDSYTGNPLDWNKDTPDQLEGLTNDKVEPFFKELGEVSGNSPVRLQKALESYITTPSTNPYVGVAYAIGNLTATNRPITDIADDFGKDILKAASRRLLKSGSDYNKTSKLMEGLSPETIEIYRKHLLLTKDVKDKVEAAKGLPKGEFNLVLKGLVEKYPDDKMRIKAVASSQLKKVKTSAYVNNLKYTRNKEVRALILATTFGGALLYKSGLDTDEIELLKELKAHNIIDDETKHYYKNMFK
jgi:ribosomal protein S25